MINLSPLYDSSNVCIFIRHAEKNMNSYDLSPEGKTHSLEFAEKLSLLNKQINVFSSPEERCIETATIINTKINSEIISHIPLNDTSIKRVTTFFKCITRIP